MTNKSNSAISNWTQSELMYFPYSPRVLAGAEVNETLEGSIAEHFNNVSTLFGITKSDLATLARSEGIRLILLQRNGVDPTEGEIKAELKSIESEHNQSARAPRLAKRASDVRGPMLSVSDLAVLNTNVISKSIFKPGLFIIYGGAESGKSHRLSRLFDLVRSEPRPFSFEYLIMGEPDHRSLGSWREIIATLRYGLLDDGEVYIPDVMFVDSLKDLIYMPSDSGSGAGGLSTETISVLSSLSAQLMREGRTVIAVINPSQPKYINEMYETLKSNVTGVFYYNPRTTKDDSPRGPDHFTPTIVGKLKSSVREWKDTYYERSVDQQIMTLIGLDGDVLDQTAGATVHIVPLTTPSERARFARNMRSKLANSITSLTPSNKGNKGN